MSSRGLAYLVASWECSIFEDLAEVVQLEGDKHQHNLVVDVHIGRLVGFESLMHLTSSHSLGKT